MNTDYYDWKSQYDRLHACFPGTSRQPVIGITGNFGEKGCELAEGYFESVLRAGATPVIIPPYENPDALVNVLEHIDGIVFSGGGDLNPLFVGEEPLPALHSINCKRDLAELMLVRLAYDRQIPMLGICRGMQMIVAALDGEIYQDIYTQVEGRLLKHSQDLDRRYASHRVSIRENSLLNHIFNRTELCVNSFHHQAVRNPGPRLKVAALSADGIIEAVESAEYKSIIGVQWHPECFILRQEESMMPLFDWLVREASSFSAAKLLHDRIITLDSHCDTPMFFHKNIQFDTRDPHVLVDLHKMREGHLDAVIMVAYLEQKERTDEALLAATAKADRILTQIERMILSNASFVELAYTPADLNRIKHIGKKAVMLGIENGYAIGKDISRLKHFRDRGIVYMTLCHNGDNDICDSARGCCEHKGLSHFGCEVVKEMNKLGLLVDLSHASEASFYNALEVSDVPIVCSHSSAKTLCDVPRNLTDEQMKRLAAQGGVAQVTLYHGFLNKTGEASILDAVNHLNHMVNVMGIDHVGIGTDFDGDGGVPGCASASEVINFTRRLMAERYSEDDIQKIWGGNFLRVMQQAQNRKEK